MNRLTKRWTVFPPVDADDPAIREAAALIRAGETVAFPTETVYGLGADARNSEAVDRIFAAKGRPSDNPLIVHIGEMSQLNELVSSCDAAVRRLTETLWPGPLTVVLPARDGAVSTRVTAGLPTVAVRMPAHPVALALLRSARCPIAAPSANRSGRPSPTRAEHVLADLDGAIAGIIDGGVAGVGVESTVVEYADGALHVLRPGGVTAEQLRRVLPGTPVLAAAETADAADAPKSPGMKYAHYAPRGRLTVVCGRDAALVAQAVARRIENARRDGERTGVLTFAERAALYDADCVVACGSLSDPLSIARGLYDALRRFDEAGVTYIVAEGCAEEGIGAAVMNRLRKAAGGRVEHV